MSLLRRTLLTAPLGLVGGLAHAAETPEARRLIVLHLQGGMDGLAAAPPSGDPALRALRPELAAAQHLPIDNGFAVHPALKTLAAAFHAGEAILAHAVGIPGAPSHREAQARLRPHWPAALQGRAACLDLGGWDTHAAPTAQAGFDHAAARLDAAIRDIKEAAGPAWATTVIVAVTEFGRSVRRNAFGGTDHGAASAAFVVGGAVAGGRVIADWPGLRPGQAEGLRPTLDTRALLKGVVADHLRISRPRLDAQMFPDSAGAPALPGLIRA